MVAARAIAERVPVPVAQHGLRLAEGLRPTQIERGVAVLAQVLERSA